MYLHILHIYIYITYIREEQKVQRERMSQEKAWEIKPIETRTREERMEKEEDELGTRETKRNTEELKTCVPTQASDLRGRSRDCSRDCQHPVAARSTSVSALTCNSCVAVALCSGLFTKHFLTKSVKSSDQSSGFLNVGGGFVGIIKIA